MKPRIYPITLYQNASWLLETTFRGPDREPLDLTQHAAELVIRKRTPDEEVILRLTSETGDILLGDAENNLVVRIARSRTAQLPTRNRDVEGWVYDLKLWEAADPEFTTVRLLEGPVDVSPSVTRED